MHFITIKGFQNMKNTEILNQKGRVQVKPDDFDRIGFVRKTLFREKILLYTSSVSFYELV